MPESMPGADAIFAAAAWLTASNDARPAATNLSAATGGRPPRVLDGFHAQLFASCRRCFSHSERNSVSLTDEAVFPAALYDVKTAIRWVKSRAVEAGERWCWRLISTVM